MLKTTVEKVDRTDPDTGEAMDNTIKLTVTVSADEVDRIIGETYKKLGAKYRFPGFRPGKAPKAILDQQLGKESILIEAAETIVNTTYPQALDAEGVRPIEAPELESLPSAAEGEEYTYSAELDIRPSMKLSSSESIEVELPSRETTQADVDAHVEANRQRFATLEPVEGRGVQVDDFVLISFKGTVDGEPYEGNEVDKYLYEMNRGLMPPEFDEGLVGASVGDDIVIEFEIPDTSANPEFVGKTARFDVTVHEIKATILPEVNDEFAGNVGGFASVDEMVEDLRRSLDLQKGAAYEQLKERRIREALAQRLVGTVPHAMVVQRQSSMMRDFLGMLESRGMTIEQYLQNTGIDMDTLDNDLSIQARQSVSEDLALEALAREKDITVSEEDLENELTAIAEATESSPEAARERWKDMGLMAIVEEQIVHRKAYEWLLDNVIVSEQAEGDEDSEDAGGTKKAAPKSKKARGAKKSEKPAEKAESEE